MHVRKGRGFDASLTICSKNSFGSGVRTCTTEQVKWSRLWRSGVAPESGDEAAADANGVFAELPAPNALEIHADWREDRHVKNGEEHVGDAFCAGKVEGDAAKAEVHDAGAVSGLVSKYGVCVCARHRDALRFARHGVDARFFGNDSERGLRGLQR